MDSRRPIAVPATIAGAGRLASAVRVEPARAVHADLAHARRRERRHDALGGWTSDDEEPPPRALPETEQIRPRVAVRPGRVVRLSFTPPDGGPALKALALLVREESEGAIGLAAQHADRPTPERVRRRQRPKRRWRC